VKTNVNERPYFQNIDVRKTLEEGFSLIQFKEKPRAEIIENLKKLKSAGLINFRKMSKGIEKAYQSEADSFLIIAWTSYEEGFREHDQAWVLIIDHRNKSPFFSFPINRSQGFFARLFATARVYRERAIHWDACTCCNQKLFWSRIQSDDFEVIDEQFHNRTLVCGNKQCQQYGIDTGVLVTEMKMPNESDRKYFAAPFERAQKTRKRNRIEGKQTIPRRLIRFWSKLGIKLPRTAVPNTIYSDTDYERIQKGKFIYNEEFPDDENYNEAHAE
jgi:hypothetical protein